MNLPVEVPTLHVSDLLTEAASALDLRLIAGESGLANTIMAHQIQKPGLALAGFFEYLHPGRVQILGRSEVEFLGGLSGSLRTQVVAQLVSSGPACFVVTRSLPAPSELVEEAERRSIPLLVTDRLSAEAIEGFHRFLEERLAPVTTMHGVLVDVYGLGVLLLGESGVGKSECALDLVVRGHRLVSDDVVQIRRIGANLVGTGVDITRYHMEVRGLGIINVKELFGVAAVRQKKFIELIIRLDPWKQGVAYDRLGLDERSETVLDMAIPLVTIPVAPGRNLSVLIEVAARHHLMKMRGYHPAQELEKRILQSIEPSDQNPTRASAPVVDPERGPER